MVGELTSEGKNALVEVEEVAKRALERLREQPVPLDQAQGAGLFSSLLSPISLLGLMYDPDGCFSFFPTLHVDLFLFQLLVDTEEMLDLFQEVGRHIREAF